MGTITGKFHQNPLKTVGGVAETRLCLRTDGRTHYYSPLRLTSGNNIIYSSLNCVLEFPGGNEIAHLLGTFMKSKICFALSVSGLTLLKPEKVVINFMGF